MFRHSRIIWLQNGAFRSKSWRSCCKGVAPWEPTRLVSTRPLARQAFIPTGFPACRSAPLMPLSLQVIRQIRGLIVCAISGRRSPRMDHGRGRAMHVSASRRVITMRQLINQMSANFATVGGARGFFSARPIPPWFQPPGTIQATSFYDTNDLKHTLERLVDFDRINSGETRFSVGAVNVVTGNFVYFDTTTHTIQPDHIMASERCRQASPLSK